MSWKRIVLAVVSLLVVLVMAACAPPTPKVVKETVVVTKEVPVEVVVTKEVPVEVVITPTPMPGVVTVMTYWGGFDKKAFDASTKPFKEKYPEADLRVETLAGTGLDYTVSLLTRVMGRTVPDVATLWSGGPTRELVAKGALADLTEFWEEAGFDETIRPLIKEHWATYEGRIYNIPHVMQLGMNVYYHKALWDELGLEEPDTWEEFKTLLATVKEKRPDLIPISVAGVKEGRSIGEWFWGILARTAGPEYTMKLASGEASFTDPEVRAAGEIIADFARKGYFNRDILELTWTDAYARVGKAEALMYMRDTWVHRVFKDVLGAGNYGHFIMPSIEPEYGKPCLAYADGWVLLKDAEHPEWGKKFIEAVRSEEGLRGHSIEVGHGIAVNNKIRPEEYDPIRKPQAEIVLEADLLWPYAVMPTIEYQDEMELLVAKIVDSPDMLDDILSDLEALKAEYYK